MKLYILPHFNEINWYFALLDNIEGILQGGYLQDASLLIKPKEMLVYGKNTPSSYIDLEKAKNKGIPVRRAVISSRRRGGVVYFGGNTWHLKWIFSGGNEEGLQREQMVKGILEQFYKSYGIEINSPFEGDVELKDTDRKLGTYYFLNFPKKGFCHGGTLFNLGHIRQDLDELIILSRSKFAGKSVKTVQERITTIPDVISRELGDEEFLESLETAMKDLGLEYQKETDLPDKVWELISKSSVKFESQEWLKYGKWSPVKDYWRPE